jgi:hypothetical protein
MDVGVDAAQGTGGNISKTKAADSDFPSAMRNEFPRGSRLHESDWRLVPGETDGWNNEAA